MSNLHINVRVLNWHFQLTKDWKPSISNNRKYHSECGYPQGKWCVYEFFGLMWFDGNKTLLAMICCESNLRWGANPSVWWFPNPSLSCMGLGKPAVTSWPEYLQNCREGLSFNGRIGHSQWLDKGSIPFSSTILLDFPLVCDILSPWNCTNYISSAMEHSVLFWKNFLLPITSFPPTPQVFFLQFQFPHTMPLPVSIKANTLLMYVVFRNPPQIFAWNTAISLQAFILFLVVERPQTNATRLSLIHTN